MSRPISFNAPKLTAELSESDDKINPLLEAAGITTIKIKGEDVPASKARLPDRIAAYADVMKTGAKSEEDVNLATLCGQITAQLEKSEAALAVAQANVATLTQEKSTLTANLSVSQANVSKLTAEITQVTDLKENALKLAGSVAAEKNSINSEISRKALAWNCLTDLKDKEGKLLPSTATAQEREQAADLIPAATKLEAISGALNSAMARQGVNPQNIPSTPAGAGAAPAKSTDYTDPNLSVSERSALFRKAQAEGKVK